ncbi:class I SAM-dependent methyltransferase [Thermodesulfobacteriota bacterium]
MSDCPLKFAHFPYLGGVLSDEARLARGRIRVLDVACGSGELANYAQIPDECDLYGLDLWGHQLRQAAGRNAYSSLLQVNLVDGLPFKSGSFDVIVCSGILIYLPNANEIVSECHRLLREGGRMFVYNPVCSLSRLAAKLKKWSRRIYQEKSTVALDSQTDWKNANRACRITYYSSRSLVEELAAPGFRVVDVRGFRISRNRLRFLKRLETLEWFSRASKYLAARYPSLASDILVEGRKPFQAEVEAPVRNRRAA